MYSKTKKKKFIVCIFLLKNRRNYVINYISVQCSNKKFNWLLEGNKNDSATEWKLLFNVHLQSLSLQDWFCFPFEYSTSLSVSVGHGTNGWLQWATAPSSTNLHLALAKLALCIFFGENKQIGNAERLMQRYHSALHVYTVNLTFLITATLYNVLASPVSASPVKLLSWEKKRYFNN